MSKFFDPMKGEMKKSHLALIIIGSLGTFPASMLARKVDSIWVVFGVLLLWWMIVVFTYLTYKYFKNNE